MIELNPATIQLLHDDDAVVIWELRFYYSNSLQIYRSDGYVYDISQWYTSHLDFIRIIPPSTRNLVDGVQSVAYLEVEDSNRTLIQSVSNGQRAELLMWLINGTMRSTEINIANGIINKRQWQNSIFSFEILNGMNLSIINSRKPLQRYQQKIDPDDTGYDKPELSIGKWI